MWTAPNLVTASIFEQLTPAKFVHPSPVTVMPPFPRIWFFHNSIFSASVSRSGPLSLYSDGGHIPAKESCKMHENEGFEVHGRRHRWWIQILQVACLPLQMNLSSQTIELIQSFGCKFWSWAWFYRETVRVWKFQLLFCSDTGTFLNPVSRFPTKMSKCSCWSPIELMLTKFAFHQPTILLFFNNGYILFPRFAVSLLLVGKIRTDFGHSDNCCK